MAKMLIDWLIEKYPTAKRQTLKRMLEAGRVAVNGRPAVKLKQLLSDTDKVSVSDRVESEREGGKAGPGFPVVYEDEDILVVNKPAGLLTSTVPREKRPTLLAGVREYLAGREPKARVGLIHRLDREASGLLIFSKNNAAYESLKTQFFKHTVHRVYLTVVQGVPKPRQGRIESNLSERIDGTVHVVKQIGKGVLAVTDYEVVKDNGKRAMVRVTLQTGRKHQIRATWRAGGRRWWGMRCTAGGRR